MLINFVFTKKEICNLNKLKGPCTQNLKRWYHDNEQKMCIEFIYGGKI